jgi:serine protease inhibitor
MKTRILLCALTVLFFWHCSEESNPIEMMDHKIMQLSTTEKMVVQSSNDFSFKLFEKVVEAGGDSNSVISPLSISMALGMTLNGADGTTYDAMQKTLEWQGLSEDQINAAYHNLIKSLVALDPKIVFEIVNSIWYQQNFEVEQNFIDVNKRFFNAEVNALDFSDPSAIDVINQWVNAKTNGKIEEIIENIETNVVMFLINTIYFKGIWSLKFDEKLTTDDYFYLPDGSYKLCKMMKQKWDHEYFENETFQAIDLAYGDGNFKMTIFLPKDEFDIDVLISNFTPDNWNLWMNSFKKDSVNILFPKFKVEFKIKLNDVLSKLGMDIAFSPFSADFTRIRKAGELWIDKVLHKTFLEVNEEGTEAAAATVVEICELSAGGENELTMHVNKPFVFFIRETTSNTILFMGKIVDPVFTYWN